MDAKLKADWIAALRSGKYQQGTGSLVSGGRYCCLGVLACVMGRTIPLAEFGVGDTVVDDDVHEVGYSFFKPLLGYMPHTDLVGRNDRGDSFESIADFIEMKIPTTENSVAESSS